MAMVGESRLPPDLLHLLCEQLATRADFATLYGCLVSSRQFAGSGAVSALYRISHLSPFTGADNESLSLAEQDQNVQKWSILWRSVILSASGKTMYPYCRFLRMLDLRDLSNLLREDKFRGKIVKYFFSKDLSRFHFLEGTPVKGRASRLDYDRIISAIGNEITQQAPLLEELSEPTISSVLTGALLTWAPRLSHLRSLRLYDGKALADESIRDVLHVHCPKLEQLAVFQSYNDDSDHHLALFIGGMQANTLKRFQNISSCGIATETCLALNTHGDSLTELELALNEDGILAVGLLQDCKSLTDLTVTALRPSVDLKATQNDVYLQIVEWLKTCSSLKRLRMTNMLSAPDLILPVLLNPNVKLTEISVNAREGSMYAIKDHQEFHRALGRQSSLLEVSLTADPDPTTRDDIEILMDMFCSLTQLRMLHCTRLSDYFSDSHIGLLAQSLPSLEDLLIGGYGITDAIFDSLSNLKQLRAATFSGITRFTSDAVTQYINSLGPGNSGLSLTVDMADPELAMSQEEQDLLRGLIEAKVDGRFEYQLLRDPNVPEFEDDEDSD